MLRPTPRPRLLIYSYDNDECPSPRCISRTDFCDVNPDYVPTAAAGTTDPGGLGLTTVASSPAATTTAGRCAGVVCAALPAGECELLENCCALGYDAVTGTSDCREWGCLDELDADLCAAVRH